MAVKMQQYIEEQPTLWQDLLTRRGELTATLQKKAESREFSRLLLVGTGSSVNAAQAAAPLLEKLLQKEISIMAPTRLSTVLPPSTETLAVLISQSGRSTSTLDAAKLLQKNGFFTVAVTADPSSPVAKAADLHVLVDCGEETVGPKTKGFTATVLTLYLMGFTLTETWKTAGCSEIDSIIKLLEHSFRCATNNISLSRSFCELHRKAFAAQPHFTLIADGIGLPIACEGALKVLETLYVPAFAYEFEEYLHGVNNTIGTGECNIMLLSEGENKERMLQLDQFCEQQGCVGFAVSTMELPEVPRMLHLEGSGKSYTQPFETLLFFQVLSALGSEAKGFDVDHPKFDGFYSAMKTKLL